MSTRGARVVRGLVVALVCLFVALAAHVSGGGQIGAVGFVLAFAFSSLGSIALSGRALSRVRVAVAVVFSQSVFHLLLGVGTGAAPSSSTNAQSMTMLGMATTATPAVVPPVAGAAPAAAMPDNGWMWAAHALAAAVTILSLIKGERTFWRLADWVADSVGRLLRWPAPVAVEGGIVNPAGTAALGRCAQFLVAGTRHRGPPERVASM